MLANSQSVDSTPEYTTLFEDIARHAEYLRYGTAPTGNSQASHEPSSKKRKIEHGAVRNGLTPNLGSVEDEPKTVVFEATDISFQIPQRKKLNLEITRSINASMDIYTIRTRNASTGTIEYEAMSSSFGNDLVLCGWLHLTCVQSIF